MKTKYKIMLTFIAAFECSNAHALGAVSRACQFSTIPTIALKSLAVSFFTAVGAPMSTLNLVGASDAEQRTWWTNESLTTDYVEARYYLYAHADVYRLYRVSQGSVPAGNWAYMTGYSSPGWGASRISRAMQSDSRFSKYYQNRGPLYSARAGNPNIVEKLDVTQYASAYAVVGSHTYYDPVTKYTWAMQDTRAIDCNLPDFGQENKGLFDW